MRRWVGVSRCPSKSCCNRAAGLLPLLMLSPCTGESGVPARSGESGVPQIGAAVEQFPGRRLHIIGERPVRELGVEQRIGQRERPPDRQLGIGPQVAQAQRPYGRDEFAGHDLPVGAAGAQCLTGGQRGEAGLLLDTAGEHGMPERGGRGERPQISEGGPGRVLQDHHARGGGLAVREERPQPGEGGLVEGREPRGGEPGHLGDREPEVIEGQSELGHVEAAVVVGGGAVVETGVRADQRVLGGGVDLDGEDTFERVGGVLRGAVDLRQTAEAVRVLDPAERRPRAVGGAEQLPHPGRDLVRAGVRTGGVDRFGVRLVRTVDREQRERGDRFGGDDEPAQLVEREGGLAEGEGIAADQGKGVVVVERLGLGRGAGPLPGVLPGEREADLGEGGDVPGTDRTELVDHRVRAGLQRLAETHDDAGPQSGTARKQLIGAHGEHGTDLAGGQRVTDGPGVAAQQAQPVIGGGLGGHALVAIGADPGGPSVDSPGRGSSRAADQDRSTRFIASIPGTGRAVPRAIRTTSATGRVLPSSSTTETA